MQWRMKMAGRWAIAVAGVVLGLALLPPPVEAAAAAAGTGRDAARAALRAQALGAAAGRTVAAAGGPAQAAAVGDLVHITDAVDAVDPRGDIREVGVQDQGAGRLRFTMRAELGTFPRSDPAWSAGSAGAFWGIDTSGDGDVEIIVGTYIVGGQQEAEVFDATSGAPVCPAYALGTTGGVGAPAPADYMVDVMEPKCFGDVKQPAVIGLFVYGTPPATPFVDLAPDDAIPVRFNRPTAGTPLGGYAVVDVDGTVQRHGAAPWPWCYDGCPPPVPQPVPQATYGTTAPPRVVGTASARPFDPGLWMVTDKGLVSTHAWPAEHHGDARAVTLSQPIVGMAVLPDRTGYWLVGRDGGIFAYGNARFYGSTGGIRLSQPIVGMAASPTGQGYWLVAADGGVFAYGDAAFHGSMGGQRLNRPVVGMAAGLTGLGYWLVAADGGIFAFGVPFHGSTGGITLQQPIVGMATTRSGGGYRFIARDGGVFSYGDAEFHGSAAAPGRTDVIGLATS